MSSTTIIKNENKIDRIETYAKNLERLLNIGDTKLKILRKNFGLIKGMIKKNPVAIQREIRKEWERKY